MTPKRLKTCRLKLKLTQKAFGDNLHTSERMIRNYEIGAFPIPVVVELATYWLLVPEKLKKILLLKFLK